MLGVLLTPIDHMEQKREETRFSTVTGGIYAIRKRITITTAKNSWSYIGTAPQGGILDTQNTHTSMALDRLAERVLYDGIQLHGRSQNIQHIQPGAAP